MTQRAKFEGWKIDGHPPPLGPFTVEIFEDGKMNWRAKLIPTAQLFPGKWNSMGEAQAAMQFTFRRMVQPWTPVA